MVANEKTKGERIMKTADLCDQCLDELQVCELSFQSYGGKRMFSGPIATVDVFEENVLVRERSRRCRRGRCSWSMEKARAAWRY
ncbi:hypothetical protein B4114_1559 [Geobacillus stearothermophilus]|uniref:Uncharacterized protein n=1 Tax=Geobacillus stearothermophilus TaxID=1422 RepID=A0A150NDJ0_GEOSE|nr:hypothetical protein B4114_1559 [Geobacillus stearothermophilus]